MKTSSPVGQLPINFPAVGSEAWNVLLAAATDCTPPAENSDAHEVALVGKDGQGACTLPWAVASKSNLDSSGLRIVRKGSVVRFRGGSTASVARVRMGAFWTATGASVGSDCFHHCCVVDVV